jgi:hypothetical protein
VTLASNSPRGERSSRKIVIVNVVVSAEAQEFVKTRGGVLFVRPTNHRCCGGTLTLLDSTITRPSDSANYVSISSEGVDVRFQGESTCRPDELKIELRGRWRRRPIAYWDGCVFKL